MRLGQTKGTEHYGRSDSGKANQTHLLLDELVKETDDFLGIVLACPISALPVSTPPEPSMSQLQDQEQWLLRQIELYKACLAQPSPPAPMDLELSFEALQREEEELNKACLTKQIELSNIAKKNIQQDLLVDRFVIFLI